tara:strand:- start:611 stop:967 length:357 start_codon:yes stop_codon:yes gene_type:complete
MKVIYMFIALVVLSTFVTLWNTKANAGGPWNDQYCNIEVTKIEIQDTKGKVIESKTEEKMVCSDGVKDFLHEGGIAESCEMFTWDMPLHGKLVNMRGIACQKINGEGYEIVQGYHNIN